MPVELLDPATEARLRALPFSYREVGQTAGEIPSGYAAFARTATLGTHDFDAASAALRGWQVQQRAGIRVRASSALVQPDAVASLRVGVGPFHVDAPCRVVYLIDEPGRAGFAYGTLPGHPEAGEEAFVLTRASDGQIAFTITAFSRPASVLAKLSGPAGRAAQRAMTGRYLRAI